MKATYYVCMHHLCRHSYCCTSSLLLLCCREDLYKCSSPFPHTDTPIAEVRGSYPLQTSLPHIFANMVLCGLKVSNGNF